MDKWFHETGKNLEVKPPDNLWDRVEARLDRKKKLTITRIWPIAAGFLILLSALLYYSVETNAGSETRNVVIGEIDLEAYPAAYYNEMADWRMYVRRGQNDPRLNPLQNAAPSHRDTSN